MAHLLPSVESTASAGFQAAGLTLAALPSSAAPFGLTGAGVATSGVEQVQWDEGRCRRFRRAPVRTRMHAVSVARVTAAAIANSARAGGTDQRSINR